MPKTSAAPLDYVVTATTFHALDGITLFHEFHDDANGFHHRLTLGERSGEWTGYAFIATLTDGVNGRRFAATTEYYDGTLPRVFEITPARKID